MKPMTPVETAGLFAELSVALVRVLHELSPEDWERPTVAGSWRVRDVVGHMLDNDLRRLSAGRDGHRVLPDGPTSTYGEVVALIDRMNAAGVKYAVRLSPRLMTDLLEMTGRWVAEHVMSLPPHGEAWIPVLWAGEERSENWMDVGREYTERWHHQMQVRDAVGAERLLARRWIEPLLDFSVRALPRAYAGLDAPEGAAVTLAVGDDDELAWTVVREAAGWRVWRGVSPGVATRVVTDADTAWRLFYNALPREEALARIEIDGDLALAAPLLSARSVMV